MVRGEEERELRLGYQFISPKNGMKALEIALKDDEGCPIIAPINWPKYFDQLQYVGRIYSKVQAAGYEKPTQMVKGELCLILEGVSSEEAKDVVTRYVREVIRQVLGRVSSQEFIDSKGFFEMGMDSLMATELRNKLQTALGDRCTLKSTVTFDYPSLEKLVDHICVQMGLRLGEGVDESSKEEAAESERISKEMKLKTEHATEKELMDELQRQINKGKENE